MATRKDFNGLFMVGLLIVAGMAVIGWVLPGQPKVPASVGLGTWNNFPLASACSTGNFTATQCELMGNQSYRQPFDYGASGIEAGVQAILSVSCITPSNTVGAFLQLQYANYSVTTRTNSSNFVNVPGSPGSGQVFIDNSANWPCGGNLVSARTLAASLPAGVNSGFLFRVVGSSGGGPGDNPRFSSISVTVFQLINKVLGFVPLSITASSFLARVTTVYPVPVATTATFQWLALNVTATSCVSLAVCIQHGSGSCSLTINNVLCQTTISFSPAFNAAPNVVGSATGPNANAIIPVASLQLLSAQTVTV